MKPIELLSDVVVQTLKEFSEAGRALTVSGLCEALSEKNEITSLFRESVPNMSLGNKESSSMFSPDLTTRDVENSTNPVSWEDSPLTIQLKNMLARIISVLGPISREEYIERSSELQQRIRGCLSVDDILAHGDDLIALVELLADDTIEKINYANVFLFGLSKDLTGIEEQLSSYQSHSKKSFALNKEFHNTLRVHTEEINEVLGKGFEGTLSLISTKLLAIGKAIEAKQQQDEIRLEEADSKITELQECVRAYNEEIVLVRERADTLEKEVLLDALMEIHNRRAYELRIREEFRRYRREGQTFSLLFIDVDHFKRINDLYGHRAGDKCLHGIAKLISSTLRQTDFVARYGGEEVVAILEATGLKDAQLVAEKVRSRIEKARFSYRDVEIPVTISIGVAEVASTDRKSDAPLVRADNAMYQAKKDGRNRVSTI